VTETGDLVGQAITTSRAADHGGPRLAHENRRERSLECEAALLRRPDLRGGRPNGRDAVL